MTPKIEELKQLLIDRPPISNCNTIGYVGWWREGEKLLTKATTEEN